MAVPECPECGETFPEGDGVSAQGSVKESGLQRLADGESVDASDLFAFDDTFCSPGCAITDSGGRHE